MSQAILYATWIAAWIIKVQTSRRIFPGMYAHVTALGEKREHLNGDWLRRKGLHFVAQILFILILQTWHFFLKTSVKYKIDKLFYFLNF